MFGMFESDTATYLFFRLIVFLFHGNKLVLCDSIGLFMTFCFQQMYIRLLEFVFYCFLYLSTTSSSIFYGNSLEFILEKAKQVRLLQIG